MNYCEWCLGKFPEQGCKLNKCGECEFMSSMEEILNFYESGYTIEQIMTIMGVSEEVVKNAIKSKRNV